MKPTPALPRLFPRRSVRLRAAVLLLAACFFAAGVVRGTIFVPNYSFESPPTTFVSTIIGNWQKLPQPANFDTGQGYTWDQIAGIFLNTPPSSTSDHITNLDGNQVAYLFNEQGMGLYETLVNTYQVGASYSMTVGIVGQGGGMLDGSVIQIQFYYLDTHGNMVVIASTTATENSTNFPNHTLEHDYTVNVPAVQSTDPWANQPIGLEIVSPQTSASLIGGYWDVDNVRVTSTPPTVPTAGFPGILACCGAVLSLRAFGRALQPRAR